MKVHLANSNEWSDGNEYIMGTASEVHTNALFDIYPNDTSITAEFKGNTQQNGTPSPSAPVPVVGVGYLDGAAYKIPVEIGLSTQSIDLSAVHTMRKIKKLVLDGTEEWVNVGGNAPYRIIINDIVTSPSAASIDWYCSHYKSVATDDSWTSYNYCISRTSTTAQSLQIRDITKDNIMDFKQYLQQQYAADTPVTIWYVLAEPEIGTVNEPLQKIRDYADSISNITLTTTAGAKSFGVDTAVKPSEITLNFRGWHPKNPKESTGGEWS